MRSFVAHGWHRCVFHRVRFLKHCAIWLLDHNDTVRCVQKSGERLVWGQVGAGSVVVTNNSVSHHLHWPADTLPLSLNNRTTFVLLDFAKGGFYTSQRNRLSMTMIFRNPSSHWPALELHVHEFPAVNTVKLVSSADNACIFVSPRYRRCGMARSNVCAVGTTPYRPPIELVLHIAKAQTKRCPDVQEWLSSVMCLCHTSAPSAPRCGRSSFPAARHVLAVTGLSEADSR